MSTLTLPAHAQRRLSDLPSPPSLPWIGHAHLFRPHRMHRQLEEWGQAHGTPYRLNLAGLQIMVIDDPEVAHALLRDRPANVSRGRVIRPVFAELGIDGLFSTEGDEWLPQRKLIMSSLNTANFRAFFPTIRYITERLYRRWRRAAETGSVVEMTQDLVRYTVDVTSALSFGEDPNTLEQDGHIIQDHLAAIFPAVMKRVVAPMPYWRWFKLPSDRALDRHLAAVHAYAHERIDRARQRLRDEPEGAPRHVLEAMLMQADQPGSGFTDEVVLANVLTLLLGGEDTTAHSLAWTMMHLAAAPELQQQMHEQAVARLGSDLVCTEHARVRDLDAFEALATEAQRLNPVVGFIGMQALRDMTVAGVALSAGTQIFFVNRPGQVSATHFADPEHYRPERWLHGAGNGPDQPEDRHNPRAFLQFGAGSRVCPGRHLAGVEMRMVLSMLMRHFEVELACDPAEIREVLNFTVTPSHMPVRLKPRRPEAGSPEVSAPSRSQPHSEMKPPPTAQGGCPFGHA